MKRVFFAYDQGKFTLEGVQSRPGKMLERRMFYYFNLTDGVEVIRDEKGICLPGVYAAVTAAMQAITEMKQEASSDAREWQDWRLEIADPSGGIVTSISLEARAPAHAYHA